MTNKYLSTAVLKEVNTIAQRKQLQKKVKHANTKESFFFGLFLCTTLLLIFTL